MTERTRTYSWDDPFTLAERMAGHSGLELILLMVAGEAASAPIAETLGFRLAEAERGRVVFECEPAEYHYNPIGTVHAGLAMTLRMGGERYPWWVFPDRGFAEGAFGRARAPRGRAAPGRAEQAARMTVSLSAGFPSLWALRRLRPGARLPLGGSATAAIIPLTSDTGPTFSAAGRAAFVSQGGAPVLRFECAAAR